MCEYMQMLCVVNIHRVLETNEYTYEPYTGRGPHHRHSDCKHSPASSHPNVLSCSLDSCFNFTYTGIHIGSLIGLLVYGIKLTFSGSSENLCAVPLVSSVVRSLLQTLPQKLPQTFSLPLMYIFFCSNTTQGKFSKTVSLKR